VPGLLLLAGVAFAGQSPQPAPPPGPAAPAAASDNDDGKYQTPPEEDESEKPKTYGFNPILAKRDVNVGDYYFKKGKFKAAADRFDEATKWNPGLAEAWLRLGESAEKLGETETMRKAWSRYLELEPNGKDSAAVKKKLAQPSGNKS
jgi:tetratricopeptide (TPR) repeat protein